MDKANKNLSDTQNPIDIVSDNGQKVKHVDQYRDCPEIVGDKKAIC